ncbi:MAG TPA: TRL-like family protein [Moraxellaceae bacterium]
MKRLLAASALAIALSGCATAIAPVNGLLYSHVTGPVAVTGSADKPTKVGRSYARSILGIYATGDASIELAAKNGGITKIHHVDHETQVILGVIADYTTIVYGN